MGFMLTTLVCSLVLLQSGVEQPRYRLISTGAGSDLKGVQTFWLKDEKELGLVWKRHQKGSNPPKIDFKREVLFGLVRAENYGVGKMEVRQVQVKQNRTIFWIREVSDGNNGEVRKPDMRTNFIWVAIPRNPEMTYEFRLQRLNFGVGHYPEEKLVTYDLKEVVAKPRPTTPPRPKTSKP